MTASWFAFKGLQRLRLRSMGDALIVDDRRGYGTKIEVLAGGNLRIDDQIYIRHADKKPSLFQYVGRV